MLAAALIAVALARVVPGRFGYWLDLFLIMFALYVVGCAVGSWLRDWVVSRSMPPGPMPTGSGPMPTGSGSMPTGSGPMPKG